VTVARRTRAPRRRDRRGRGLRGLMYPASTPASRTRAEKFDAMVLEALEPIELRWGSELEDLDLAVDEVPEVDETSPDAVWPTGVLVEGGVPLAQLVPAGLDPQGLPSKARIVLYRRPLESRAPGGDEELADLLHEVLVEQVAEYLNIDPDAVDGSPS
jgi:predicted Zn-dependent protease with MMP-like domain